MSNKKNDENEELSNLMITLESSDKVKLKISKNLVGLSGLLKTMYDDDDDDDDDDGNHDFTNKDTNVILPNVNSKNLKIIINFMQMYSKKPFKEIPKPLESNNLSEAVGKEYMDILPKNNLELIELLNSANYMHITSLMNLCCAFIASTIKGKSIEEVEKEWGNLDLTDEEKTQIENEKKFFTTDDYMITDSQVKKN
jgi:S-phase kinase-associated protein 1